MLMRRLVLLVPLAACVETQAPDPAPGVSERGVSNHRPPRFRGQPQANIDGDKALDLFWLLPRNANETTWYVDTSSNGFGSFDVKVLLPGTREDQPVPADYDNDGHDDLAIRNSVGTWAIDVYEAADVSGMNGGFDGQWDFVIQEPHNDPEPRRADPVPADYNGDDFLDLAVVGSDGTWRIDYYDAGDASSDPGSLGFGGWDDELAGYGGPDQYPVPADYDGDKTIDIATRGDDGTWRIDYAVGGFTGWDEELPGYGTNEVGMVAAVADFDDDGRGDPSVRSYLGLWFIDLSRNGYGAFDIWPSGFAGIDERQPLAGDYTGDGLADLVMRTDCGPWSIWHNHGLDDEDRPIFFRIDETVSWQVDLRETVVNDVEELTAALDQDFLETIHIPSTAAIDVKESRGLLVRDCKRIRSDRAGLRPGGLIFTDDDTDGIVFEVIGDGVRFDHLRLRGPTASSDPGPHVTGIHVASGRNFRFDHNEIFHFPRSAVSIDDELERIERGSGIARVEDSFFHHNQRDEFGYGVVVGDGGWARVERNVFNWHRHALAHDGSVRSGYLAYRNYLLEGTTGYVGGNYWGQHFDVHGDAGGHHGNGGEYFEIAQNTVRGEQAATFNIGNRPVLRVRGTPTDHIDFHHNATCQDEDNSITNCWSWPFEDCVPADIREWANKYDFDQSLEYGVGDFDGDGRSDIFLGTGVTWWYSSGGIAQWRYLNDNDSLVAGADDFYIAQVDNERVDGRLTDDVIRSGNAFDLLYSSGGRGPWLLLTSAPGPFDQLHFADFTGDGITDIFSRATDGRWHIFNGVTRFWTPTLQPSAPFSELRFGQFDGVAGLDVLVRQGGSYWISSRGNQPLAILNSDRGSLATTVVDDFDGDGRDDVVRRSGDDWLWLPQGLGNWQLLRPATAAPTYADLDRALVGEFDENPGADVVRVSLYMQATASGWVERDGNRFVKWTRNGAFEPWSEQEIR
jgi:hypothetical protein